VASRTTGMSIQLAMRELIALVDLMLDSAARMLD
jgi:hypothetical protein